MRKSAKSARREFVNQYGTTTLKTLELIRKGTQSVEIARRLGVSVGSVAAVRANLTRGTYLPFATAGVRVAVKGTIF